MTQKIIDKLLPYYREGLVKVKETKSYDKALNLCIKLKLDWGICKCSREIFQIELIGDKWINSKKGEFCLYFYDCPRDCDSIDEIIESLEYRIKLMESFKE